MRWLHKESGFLSWAQPLPQLVPLSGCDYLEGQAGGIAFAAAETFEGAPRSAVNPVARTGICGRAPDPQRLRRWVPSGRAVGGAQGQDVEARVLRQGGGLGAASAQRSHAPGTRGCSLLGGRDYPGSFFFFCVHRTSRPTLLGHPPQWHPVPAARAQFFPSTLPRGRTCQLLSPEHMLYPDGLFEAVGVTRIVFCEGLQ